MYSCIHLYIFMYTYIHIYIYTFIHLYMYTYIHMYIYTYIHKYIFRYLQTIYIYLYIYIHTYLSIYNIYMIHDIPMPVACTRPVENQAGENFCFGFNKPDFQEIKRSLTRLNRRSRFVFSFAPRQLSKCELFLVLRQQDHQRRYCLGIRSIGQGFGKLFSLPPKLCTFHHPNLGHQCQSPHQDWARGMVFYCFIMIFKFGDVWHLCVVSLEYLMHLQTLW